MATKTTGSRSGSSGVEINAKNVNAEDRKYLQKHGNQLSKTTLRAKWIHSPVEHQDRSGQTLATRSPDVIRAWAEARRGQPATVARKDRHRPHTLRFDFPAGGQGNRSGSSRLEPIGWDEWLKTFQQRDLVFLFQEELRDGRQSNFFRLDNPKRNDA